MLASRKLEGETLAAKTWYVPFGSIVNHRNASLESDCSCKLRPDGTGTVSLRSFGYTKPGVRFRSCEGSGAYTDICSWPISWEARGGGIFRMKGTGPSTATNALTSGLPPVALRYAKMNGNVLVLYLTDGTKLGDFSPVDPKDPRMNPSQSEINRRLADWAVKGPKLIAETEAKYQAQQVAEQQRQARNAAIIGGAIRNYQLNPYTTPYIPH